MVGYALGGCCEMARWASMSKLESVGTGRDAIDVDTDGKYKADSTDDPELS
jgi:hypothetical protein